MNLRALATLLAALLPAVATAEPEVAPAAAVAPAPAAAPDAAPAAQVEEKAAPPWAVTANATEEYRFRSSDSPSESDHWGRLFLNVEANSPTDTFAVRGAAGFWMRFSGAPDVGLPYGLASEHTDNPWLDVYSLSADWRPNGILQRVRLGRQETEYGQPETFDGLSLVLRPIPILRVFAFGGRTEHFFEVEQGFFEDWLASAGVEIRTESLKIVADYRFLREAVADSNIDPTVKKRLTNNSYGIAAWYRYGGWLRARAQVRGLDASLSQVSAAVRAEWVAQQLGAEAKIDVQPVELGEINEFDNPFFLTLGSSKPHLKARVDLFKGFTSNAGEYAIHLGGDARALFNSADDSAFNRNLLRAYLLVSAQKIGGTGLFASVTGEYDSVSSVDKGVFAVGGSLGWDQKPVRAEVGTAYLRYQYRYYALPEEIADVREIYADVKVRVVSWLALRARYSFEIFDRRLHTVTVSLSQAY
jgi:hypothetical protein